MTERFLNHREPGLSGQDGAQPTLTSPSRNPAEIFRSASIPAVGVEVAPISGGDG
jgi:hypothetical protein